MTNRYSDNYLKNQIESASREQLLLMFYDGAIRFITRAENAINEGKIEQKNHNINKANAIVTELSVTLDHEIGGHIASDLEALYDFMNRELIKASISNSAKPLITVKQLLTDLRDTWAVAISDLKCPRNIKEITVEPDTTHKPLSLAL